MTERTTDTITEMTERMLEKEQQNDRQNVYIEGD